MFKYEIKEISKNEALEMIKKYHYSNTLPKINKHYIGFYFNKQLVGVVTLGWGTRPRHTIQKLFPNLDTKDYYEIGRMCMNDDMPRNSESQMLSQLIKYIKNNYTEIKILFTWADGLLGKPGYVYQASNFLYAGENWGEMYLKDGVKIHPRQMKMFLSPDDKRITVRPTLEELNEYGIQHVKGKQYKYIYFIKDRQLEVECTYRLTRKYPKLNDLEWKIKNSNGKWEETEKPYYLTDINKQDKEKMNFNMW